ncbi:MAG: GntR family transcriptional regulator [Desulfobacteraceae bacterium]|nr:GntR family transcriptional regulator [Desulfobacteraceae bacterium]
MQRSEQSKNQEAYQALKQLIVEQKLSPGQKLICRDLEEALNMSKTPIINGLTRLEQEGLVVSKRNRGFFMKDVSREEAEQIYELRERLEMVSMDFAVQNRTEEDLRVLEEMAMLYHEYRPPFYDRRSLELDTDIHMYMARMGKNDFFTSMLRTFFENMYFTLNVIHLTPYINKFDEEHMLLVEAIRDRDLQKAQEVIRRHIRAARKHLTGALSA